VCPKGYYGEAEGWVCKECHASCETCSGKLETNCLSCKDDYIFTKLNECKRKKFHKIILLLDEPEFIAGNNHLNVEKITTIKELEFKTE